MPSLFRIGLLAAALVAAAAAAPNGPAARSAPTASSPVSAERAVYAKLDDALDFVGAPRVDAKGALTWRSVAGDDSGSIVCKHLAAGRFSCSWSARLIQSYAGTVEVTYSGDVARLSFTKSSCANPKGKGLSQTDLCSADPVPGMPGY